MRLLTILLLLITISCGGSKRTSTESTTIAEEKKVDSVSYKERVVEKVYLPSSYMSTFKIKLDSLGNIEPIVFKTQSNIGETTLMIDSEGNITLEGSTEELKSTSTEIQRDISRDVEVYKQESDYSSEVRVKRPFPVWVIIIVFIVILGIALRLINRLRL